MAEQRRIIPPPPPARPPDQDRLPSTFTVRAVGVSFAPDYPANLGRIELDLRREELGLGPSIELPVALEREPDNPVDPNCVRLVVEGHGMVGHVPASMARRLAPRLDAGEPWTAMVAGVETTENRPDKPGIAVKVSRG